MRPINILIYEPYILGLYGNTRYLTLLIKFIDRKNFNVTVAGPSEGPCFTIIKKMHGNCMVVTPPPVLKAHGGTILRRGALHRLLTILAVAKHTLDLSFLIKRKNIDIIHCNSIRALMTIGWAAKVTGRPCIWYVKGDLGNKVLDRIGFVMADRILFLSEMTKNLKYPELIRKYYNKIEILKIGLDLTSINSICHDNLKLRQELSVKKENINLAYLGAIAPYKGLDYLIDAVSIVKNRVRNIMLYIVGDHCVEEYAYFKNVLKEKLKDNSLIKNVQFTGWRPDALDILSLMDIYVLPSLSEGVPRSIVEAMALGKPVVSTKVGGIPEIVLDGETGFIVPPRDPNGLADGIITLAKDDQLRARFGDKGQKTVIANYSIERNIAGLQRVYLEVVEKNQENEKRAYKSRDSR
jgi:glycosyltransferase involved in cell wall biosynthesis